MCKQQQLSRSSSSIRKKRENSTMTFEVLLPFFLGCCALLPVMNPVIAQYVSYATRDPVKISTELSEKAALDELLHKSQYDRRLLPPTINSLAVNVSVLLLTLASPDESSLKYEVEFLMNLFWFDPRLKFHLFNTTGTHLDVTSEYHEAIPMRANPRRRDYLDALHHFGKVWVPDVYFVKHGDFRTNLDPVNVALRIYPNGTVHFTTRRHLILSCQGELGIFPFDDPLCEYNIESISHEKDALEFRWQTRTGVLRKSPNLSFLNAYLAHNETSYCESSHWRGNYSCLKVKLIFNRDRAYYFTTVFIPDIILVTSSFITFWLEWNAVPARIMLGVTTMLNFFTTSNGFRATLPVVSNLTAMNIWDGGSMLFIYLSLLEFVFVNYIGRKRPRPPSDFADQPTIQLNKIEDNAATTPSGNRPIDMVTCTTCSTSNTPCTHPANNGCAPPRFRRRILSSPIHLAKRIDVISRVVFPAAYSCFLIYFFLAHRAFIGHSIRESD
ncbi:glutamate-gated chloride channel isoform X2 [Folsomia candida]|uniref:glutamate-gated chloride channel isoform X2 n=1 Tax=Folsomia candida TaxID=158441 RepID=UPI001604B8B5|nr:glutamate-gated chloride channel isoform X2 [Folsomia candida]